jgi:integrase/recombinase XerD
MNKTLIKLLDECIEDLEGLNYSIRTKKSTYFYSIRFIRYLNTNYGVIYPNELKKDYFTQWCKHLSTYKTDKGYPLKATALNRWIAGVKCFIRYMSENGYILKSYIEEIRYVKAPKLLPEGALDYSRVRKILSKINCSTKYGYRDRSIVELLYSTAIRADELLKLNISDIDFKNRTLRVMGKGAKERVVPIGKTAFRCLETYVKAIRPFMLKKGNIEALFINYRGDRYRYQSLLKMTKIYSEAAKSEFNVTPHTFRRSCATEMLRNGANIYYIKELLGHENLDSLKHYTKLTITDLKKAHARYHPREVNN